MTTSAMTKVLPKSYEYQNNIDCNYRYTNNCNYITYIYNHSHNYKNNPATKYK